MIFNSNFSCATGMLDFRFLISTSGFLGSEGLAVIFLFFPALFGCFGDAGVPSGFSAFQHPAHTSCVNRFNDHRNLSFAVTEKCVCVYVCVCVCMYAYVCSTEIRLTSVCRIRQRPKSKRRIHRKTHFAFQRMSLLPPPPLPFCSLPRNEKGASMVGIG